MRGIISMTPMQGLYSFWDRLTTNPRMRAAQDARKERNFIHKMVKGDDPESTRFRNRVLHDVHADRIATWGRRRSPENVLGMRGPGGDYVQYDFEDSYNPLNAGLLSLNEKMEFNFNDETNAKEFEQSISSSAMGMTKMVGNKVHVHILPPKTTRVRNAIVKAAKQQGGVLVSTEPYTKDSFGHDDDGVLQEGSLSTSRVSRAGEQGRPGREQAWAMRQGMRIASQLAPSEINQVIRGNYFQTPMGAQQLPHGVNYAQVSPGSWHSRNIPLNLRPHPGQQYHNPLYGRDLPAGSRVPITTDLARTSGYGDVMRKPDVTQRSMLNYLSTIMQQRGQRLGQQDQSILDAQRNRRTTQHNTDAQNS